MAKEKMLENIQKRSQPAPVEIEGKVYQPIRFTAYLADKQAYGEMMNAIKDKFADDLAVIQTEKERVIFVNQEIIHDLDKFLEPYLADAEPFATDIEIKIADKIRERESA